MSCKFAIALHHSPILLAFTCTKFRMQPARFAAPSHPDYYVEGATNGSERKRVCCRHRRIQWNW